METENRPLISVIVPLYNADEYLDRCIKSILNQTYQNIELILVNDGSTDYSESICEKYEARDSRITLIQTDNHGNAAARNLGLDNVHGDYVSFVDADDFVESNYILLLFEHLINNKVDVSACGHNLVYANGQVTRELKQQFYSKDYVIYMDRNTAITNMLYKKLLLTSVWGKLFRTELLFAKRFPKCRFNEDLPFLYDVLLHSNGWVFANAPTYNYYQRNNSLTHNLNTDYLPDSIRICEEIKNNASEISTECEKAAWANLLQYCFYCYFAYPKNDSKFYEEISYITKIIFSGRANVLCDKNASVKVRGACLLSYAGMGFTEMVYSAFTWLSTKMDILKHSK